MSTMIKGTFDNIAIGTVVKSIAGRDQGRYYVAVTAKDRFVFIADGTERKLEKPKRKNVKHISPTHRWIDITGLTNKKLKKLLAELETQSSDEVETAGQDDEMRDFNVKRRCN